MDGDDDNGKQVHSLAKGSRVEVTTDEEGLKGAWYLATVLHPPFSSGSGSRSGSKRKNRKYASNSVYVEYQSLFTDEDGTKPLKEHVTLAFVRPVPPPPPLDSGSGQSFGLNDVVDAFYRDGWWTGVIAAVLDNSRFLVTFQNPPDEIEFGLTELRVHREWIGGKWVEPPKQDVLIASNDQERGHAFNNAKKSEISEDNSEDRIQFRINSRGSQVEQSTPRSGRPSSYGSISRQRKMKQATSDIDASLSRPLKKSKQGTVPDTSSLPARHINRRLIDTPNKEELLDYSNPTTGATGTNCLKQSITGSVSHGRKTQTRQKNVGEEDYHSVTTVQRKGRKPKSQVKSPQPSVGEGNAALVGAEEFRDECITKEIDIPVIEGLQCNGMKGSQAKQPHCILSEESLKLMRDQKEQLDNPTRLRIKGSNLLNEIGEVNHGSNLLEGVGEVNQIKRRGRPPKLKVSTPEASVADKVHKEVVISADEIVVKDCITSECEAPITVTRSTRKRGAPPSKEYMKIIGDGKKPLKEPITQKSISSSKKKMPLSKKSKQLKEKVGQESGDQFEKHPSTSERSAGLDIKFPIQGKTAEALEADSSVMGDEMAIEQIPCSISDDQPLSMWIEGMQSPTNIHGLRVSPSQTQRHSETTERRKESALRSPAVGANTDIITYENQNWPFVKSVPLWGTIESMEAFELMPQKPHFGPLGSCNESVREGFAIGLMVIFSKVVKKTSEMNFYDSRSTIEDTLETLVELESHGFDVRMIRDRLTELLLIKDQQEHLEENSKGWEDQLMKCKREKSEADEQIDEIDKQMKELEEKRSRVLLMKESKDTELALLESKVESFKKSMERVQLEFEGLVAAPW